MPARSDIPGWLWLDQRRWSVCRRGYWTLSSLVVNMTNLIIANVETLSHDDGYSYSFSSDGHQFGGGGMAPWPRSGSATGSGHLFWSGKGLRHNTETRNHERSLWRWAPWTPTGHRCSFKAFFRIDNFKSDWALTCPTFSNRKWESHKAASYQLLSLHSKLTLQGAAKKWPNA